MISLTRHCCRKSEVGLHFFAEDAQNNKKTHSYKDNAKFHFTFLQATLRFAPHILVKTGSDKKMLNIWANLEKIFKNVGCAEFCIY
jgi:hypothetical protein